MDSPIAIRKFASALARVDGQVTRFSYQAIRAGFRHETFHLAGAPLRVDGTLPCKMRPNE
jgi:hypothetical protein